MYRADCGSSIPVVSFLSTFFLLIGIRFFIAAKTDYQRDLQAKKEMNNTLLSIKIRRGCKWMGLCSGMTYVSTKSHPLERLGAASPMQLLEKRGLHESAFWRRMSLYTTQLQGPVMAATEEQSCLKLTFVWLAIDPCMGRLQWSNLC